MQQDIQEPTESSLDATDLYLKGIGAAPLLTKEEEVFYARRLQKGDMSAKNRMIESNLRLVVKIAKRYLRSGMAILDLIEEGNLGLIRGVEKFNPELGFRFSTYGAWWIQQTIERAIMCQNRTIRLPVHIGKRLNGFLRAQRALDQKLDHTPTPKELAENIGCDINYVEQMMTFNERIVSIDSPVSDEINKPLLDTVEDELNPTPLEAFEYEHTKRHINHWLSQLTDLQQKVVQRRFGLNNFALTTLERTGEEIGITRERVRQLQADALKSLKVLIEEDGDCIGDFFD